MRFIGLVCWLAVGLAFSASAETFEEKCREAGGISKSACRCPDGRYINPYVEKCPKEIPPPPTPEAFEAECNTNDTTFVGPKRYTFETLKKFIEAKDVTDPSDLIKKLALDPTHRDLVSSYVLIWGSRSTQTRGADAGFPRRVFFRGGLIFASVEHPAPIAAELNKSLEVIQYDDASGEFHFKAIDFSEKPAKVSEAPKNCLNCHGEKTRPVWPTYRSWPGAYNHGTEYFHPKGPRPVSGAYASLRPTNNGEDAAAFNSYLNRLNFRRIAKQLEASADFERYRLATIGALLKCEDLPSFLGKARAAHEAAAKSSYLDFVKETAQKIEAQYIATESLARRLKDTRAIEALRDKNDRQDGERVAGLRYLFEARGVDVKNFSLYYSPGRKTFGYGFHEDGSDAGGLRRLLCQILPTAVRKDASLRELTRLGIGYVGTDPASDRAVCELIRKKSAEAFGG